MVTISVDYRSCADWYCVYAIGRKEMVEKVEDLVKGLVEKCRKNVIQRQIR